MLEARIGQDCVRVFDDGRTSVRDKVGQWSELNVSLEESAALMKALESLRSLRECAWRLRGIAER